MAIAAGLQHVALVDVLIARMMARQVTDNVVVVGHLLHLVVAVVVGHRVVDLEAAPIVRTMVRPATANAVVVGLLLARPAHQARQPLVPNGARQLGTSQ